MPKDNFFVEDFFSHDDDSFVRNAYLLIIGREPVPRECDEYLTGLRRGDMSKTDILWKLRYSPEGREKRVKIRGLLLSFLVSTLFRVPVLGYFFHVIVLIARLPILLKNARVHEAYTSYRFTEQRNTIKSINSGINTEIADLIQQMRDLKLNSIDQQRRLTVLLEETRRNAQEPISADRSGVVGREEEHLLDAMYVAFEDRFRGTREDIKNRLRIYLPHIEKVMATAGNGAVLDIGCGRGEWLELLKEKGYAARGIDLNRMMIRECEELGFDVTQFDVIEYLRKQPAKSLSAITGFHIIEHLSFNVLVAFLDESFRTLREGGVIVLETPNPENLVVGSCNFYLDPQHKNPIPPDVLRFLSEQRGFVKNEIIKLHKLAECTQTGQEALDAIIRRYFMEQDYALIGYSA